MPLKITENIYRSQSTSDNVFFLCMFVKCTIRLFGPSKNHLLKQWGKSKRCRGNQKSQQSSTHDTLHLQRDKDKERGKRTYMHTYASHSPYLSVTWLQCFQSAKYVTTCSFPKNTFSVHYCLGTEICANMLSLSFHD